MTSQRKRLLSSLVLVGALLVGGTTAASAAPMLWRIGSDDNSTREFALGPGGFAEYLKRFPKDPVYLVGRSSPRDWPYTLPGPADGWAGLRAHTFTIRFALYGTPRKARCALVLDLVDTHEHQPPTLFVSINGTKFERQMPNGYGGRSIAGTPSAGRAHRVRVGFSAELLRQGTNEVRLSNVSGSWVLFDWIGLEVPSDAGVTLGVATPRRTAPTRQLSPEEKRRLAEEERKREEGWRKYREKVRVLEEKERARKKVEQQRKDAARQKREQAKQRYEAKSKAAWTWRQERLHKRRKPRVRQRRFKRRVVTKTTIPPAAVPQPQQKKEPVTPQSCAMLRRSWAGGPKIRYKPPKPRRRIERLRETARGWVGWATRKEACAAAELTAEDKIVFGHCPRKGWKWTGAPRRNLDCSKCTNKPNWGWTCTATVELWCEAPQIGAVEIEARRPLIRDLLGHAMPKLIDIVDEWLQMKSGMSTAIPGAGFLELGVSLRAAKRAAEDVERKAAQLTSDSTAKLVKAVDSAIADLERAVNTVSRQMASCR